MQKDLDILEEGRKLRFAEKEARGRFLEVLAREATFLARLEIMHYSLLLGCHDGDSEEGEGAESASVGSEANAGISEDTEAVTDTNENPSTPRNNQRKTPIGREEPLS